MGHNVSLHVIVLAAGHGTRMRSKTPKVMHTLAGFPLVEHALLAAKNLKATSTTLVVSPTLLSSVAPLQEKDRALNLAVQQEANGTAGAVLATKDILSHAQGVVLILFADTPLVRPQVLSALVSTLLADPKRALTVLALEAPNHPHYGRVILEPEHPERVARIVEVKNATPEEEALSLCNAGLMAVRCEHLFELLSPVTPNTLTKELYLTDIVALARKAGLSVGWEKADFTDAMGINTRKELATAEIIMQARLREKALDQGVMMVDPTTTYLSLDTTFGADVTLYPHVYFGRGVTLGDETQVHSFSHLEGATLEKGVSVGPYARLRPGTHLKDGARVGNFVELKATTLGANSKVNHLTYLGDSTVGGNCNIGAGTITCNYDGQTKHKTHIEDDVFVGSNSTLIAPLHLGRGAYVGAGSILTQNVAPGALALSRVPQKEIPGAALRLKARLSLKKESS
ncbi:MAG: bifunctional UDP-N-acetylglucosamine diphosphorylase/glucosamine-1-phosphate N-acetyltransferase GlmU [Alphaproteobacteria bacterium]|nr:bifunctional UDP-N-acetylglucosamine diphosphorylase/glucosamine-1-phosphate N-acetyltransferase GlmU [Alphaproteobacteria bacterium]